MNSIFKELLAEEAFFDRFKRNQEKRKVELEVLEAVDQQMKLVAKAIGADALTVAKKTSYGAFFTSRIDFQNDLFNNEHPYHVSVLCYRVPYSQRAKIEKVTEDLLDEWTNLHKWKESFKRICGALERSAHKHLGIEVHAEYDADSDAADGGIAFTITYEEAKKLLEM